MSTDSKDYVIRHSFKLGCIALMDFLYNTSPQGMVRAVFPEAHQNYVDEKVDVILRSPARWFSSLDKEARDWLIEHVWIHHAEAALRINQQP